MPREVDLLPDWFLGGAGKRRLLQALVDEHHPLWRVGPPWSARQLADAAELHEKNTVQRHLRVLKEAGLLARDSLGRWTVEHDSELLAPLRSYLQAVNRLPPRSLPPSRGGASTVR